MNRMELIDVAAIPGGGELRLFRRGNDYSIRLAGLGGELMSTRMHGSEDALARIVCPKIASREKARVLVGGLGIGFTLAATLKHLGDDAEVIVAELVPGVVDWNRHVLGAFAGHPLTDPRVQVRQLDVGQVLREEQGGFDGILLDVDNGPEGLTRRSNDWLYSDAGLAVAKSTLRPGGYFAVWSAGPDARFAKRLKQTGMRVDEIPVRAHGNKGARHLIWLARRD